MFLLLFLYRCNTDHDFVTIWLVLIALHIFQMPDRCEHCGCTDIDVDPARGDSVCTGCGTVLSEHAIVNEVQFMENSRGQSSAIGQFISHESNAPRPLFKGCQGTFSKESREITYHKGKKRITCLANQLDLSQHCHEVAYNFFKLCVSKGLTRGRKSAHIIGACVYMTCRIEATPHMLIDVSDMIEVDVYELGRTYLRLSTDLCLNIPAIDPCLYIIRFAHKLKFGDKTHEVSETALRLVKRMKKDWMHTGRRPSGVCGAALVIAARYHNFNRTIQDVIKIVKVHESTLRKRLTEFGSTPSSGLTPDEFMNTDLDQEEDPPAFKAARRKEEEAKIQELMDQEKDINNQFTNLQLEIEKMLNERKTKLRGYWAAAAASGSSTPKSTSGETMSSNIEIQGNQESSDTQRFVTEATMLSIQDCLDGEFSSQTRSEEPLQEILPTTASMGLKQTIEESMEIRPSEPQPAESGILDLEGIDDDEIDSYILTDREQELKTNVWMNLNKEYLEEMEKKKEQERLEEEQRVKEGRPAKKKKAYKKKDKSNEPANTAGEAMERLIKVKKLSNKIDYNVLRNLNGETDDVIPDNLSVTSKASSSRSSRSSKRKVNHPPIPDSIKEIMQSLTGHKTPTDAIQQQQEQDDDADSVPIFKRQKLQEEEMERQKKQEEEQRRIEEQQQQQAEEYGQHGEYDDNEELEDENEEEEDDDLRGLLGTRNDDDYDEYYSD